MRARPSLRCAPTGRLTRVRGCRARTPVAQETVGSGSIDRKAPVNIIIGCVDNFEARQAMEAVSEELQVPFMDAVVSDDAMSGSVQLIIPGRTGAACPPRCAPVAPATPRVPCAGGLEASPIKAHMEKRPGACPASLATTDSILAGITAQNVLKYLLGFGEVAFLLQYNAVTNDFSTRMTYPDPRKQPVTPA